MGGLTLHYRKNIAGTWEICSLTVDEAKSIQEKIIKIGLGKFNEIVKMANENKVQITSDCIAIILSKVMPSYESLANDYIESAIKKKLNAPTSQA